MVAVTGATGFLGKHIVSQLETEDYKVLAFGRDKNKGTLLNSKKTKFIKADILDKDLMSLNLKGVKTVIHSAAKSTAWGDYSSFYKANVIGTRNTLEAAIKNGVKKFIHISSTSVYFEFKDKFGIKESDPYAKKFSNHYASTKKLAELEVLKVSDKIETVILRPRGIIGEGDNAIIPRIMKIAESGSFPMISKGRAIADITYVKNVVQSILLVMKSDKAAGEIFNISNDQPVSVNYLIFTLFQAFDKKIKYRKIPRYIVLFIARILEITYRLFSKKEPPITTYTVGLLSYSQVLDITKAKTLLGYKPKYTLEQGIKNAVKEYQTRLYE